MTDNQRTVIGGTVRQVHMPDEREEYGVKFVCQPLREEQDSVRRELIRAAKKTKKYKDYNADSPGLTAALKSDDSDEWVKAINVE